MKTTLLDHCSSSLALFNPSGCHTKIADAAESGIFKLKTRRRKNQPILLHVFLQSSGCSRCSAKTVSFDVFKGKTNHNLSKGKYFTLTNPPYTWRSSKLNRGPFRTISEFQNGTSIFFLPQFFPTR